MSEEDRRILEINAKSMIAGLVGWSVCAFFASVAFNWTFYYVLALAVAGREIVASRRHVPRREKNAMRATSLVRAARMIGAPSSLTLATKKTRSAIRPAGGGVFVPSTILAEQTGAR